MYGSRQYVSIDPKKVAHFNLMHISISILSL